MKTCDLKPGSGLCHSKDHGGVKPGAHERTESDFPVPMELVSL